MVGNGSLRHNNRSFHAGNVDPERSSLNIAYCDEDIRKVYHELFDEALEKFNAKQTRADRRIADYYEKIRSGKQEKLFHEVVIQIGNRDDTPVDSDAGKEAVEMLDEYMKGFQERNPNLRVFAAHMHLDEATPHLHIDFVPFTTGSKRGLETRVSLKKALEAQGFAGVNKKDSEWARWIQSEKEQLASIMERHGLEWEHKGTTRPHLDVLDYKVQERQKELEELNAKVADREIKAETLEKEIEHMTEGIEEISEITQNFDTDPEYQLPEPKGMMTAKTYKTKFVEPLIKKLKDLVVKVLHQHIELKKRYEKWRYENYELYNESKRLRYQNEDLRDENKDLRLALKDFERLCDYYGATINEMLDKAYQHKSRNRSGKNR